MSIDHACSIQLDTPGRWAGEPFIKEKASCLESVAISSVHLVRRWERRGKKIESLFPTRLGTRTSRVRFYKILPFAPSETASRTEAASNRNLDRGNRGLSAGNGAFG